MKMLPCLACIFSAVIFGGDFNMVFNDNGYLSRHHLQCFICDLQLNFVDDKKSYNDKFTCRVYWLIMYY